VLGVFGCVGKNVYDINSKSVKTGRKMLV
jgi:hypothetical protein